MQLLANGTLDYKDFEQKILHYIFLFFSQSTATYFSSPSQHFSSQKTRHLTTGSSYKLVHQLVLGLVSASHFGHYVFGLCLFNSPLLLVVLLIYLVRISVVWLLYVRILRKLDAQRLLPWIPLLDAAFVLYYILFAPVLITGKQQQWK